MGHQKCPRPKKTLNRQRQQRRRARLRAEQRMRDRDVSEEEDDEIPLPDVDVHPLERAEPDREEHTWANEELQQEDVQVVARRRIVTELAQRPDNAHATQYNDAITAIGKELAKIKVSSNVSDAALDKVFKLFNTHREDIFQLVDDGSVQASYTKGFKPALIETLLPIFSTILLKEQIAGEPTQYRKLEELKSIPSVYLNLREEDTTKLLRMDTYVHVKDAKQFYFDTHGGRTATTLQHTRHCALSVDGVAESKMGSRTFIVASIRFGSCLYLLRIFNSLVGVDESKPSAKELLRYQF